MPFGLQALFTYKSKGILEQGKVQFIYRSLMELRSNKTSFNSFKKLY